MEKNRPAIFISLNNLLNHQILFVFVVFQENDKNWKIEKKWKKWLSHAGSGQSHTYCSTHVALSQWATKGKEARSRDDVIALK